MLGINYVKAPFGIIDMGSNGIRFCIVQSLKRHLPVSYEERAPISLLEAQTEDRTIPNDTIEQVITSFKRFQSLCQFEGIDPLNIQVIATEATRIASNSKQFLKQIHTATGLTVNILSKEQEATISSMGIAGSFYKIQGLTMDLGGGSVELNHYASDDWGSRKRRRTFFSPVSFPFGAVVMQSEVSSCAGDVFKLKQLENDIMERLKAVSIPASDTVYLSGGGFRALGYLSMADTHTTKDMPITPVTPTSLYIDTTRGDEPKYPIPIISGYSMTGDQLLALVDRFKQYDPDVLGNKLKAFRISKRRARLLPATCFLVSAMLKVLRVRHVYFSEGGVRQGLCYHLLPPSERDKDPLLEGIREYMDPRYKLPAKEHDAVLAVLKNAVPSEYLDVRHPFQLARLVPAAVLLANTTSHYPKETRAYVAFHMPLASGPLANVTGLVHSERAVLALLLAYRQGGDIPDTSLQLLESRVGKEAVSICKYIGKLMQFLFMMSPRSPSTALMATGIKFDLKQNESLTSRYVLQITLPQKNDLLDAQGVVAFVKSMNKKIQIKKWNHSEHAMFKSNHCLNDKKLFTVEIRQK